MNKKDAVILFGSQANLARAIGVVRAAVSKWPDEMTPIMSDRVLAACVREGIDPSPLLEDTEKVA